MFYEKVKNGSKITLSTVTNQQDSESTRDVDKDKVKYTRSTVTKYSGNTTSTTLYIVYQDKYTKEYHVEQTPIFRIIK